MADYSYLGVSSISQVPLGSYVDSRPTSSNMTPTRRYPGSNPQTPLLLNGRTPPRTTLTPMRRDSQETEVGTPRVTQDIISNVTLFSNKTTGITPEKWFNAQMHHRRLLTGLWTGVTSFFIMFIAIVAFQCTLWAPIKSISAIINSFFSPMVYGVALFSAIIQELLAYFNVNLLAKVDQQKRASLTKAETWIAFFLNISTIIGVYCLCFQFFLDYSLIIHTGVFHLLLIIGSIITAVINIFSHDFQLLFGGIKMKSNVRETWYNYMLLNITSSFSEAVYRACKAMIISSLVALVLVPIIFGFSGWIFIFNLSGHFALASAFTAQILIGYVFHRIVRQKILEPMHFQFLPSYAICNPTDEQRRNMAAVLVSQDPLLQLFAFFDLRFLAWFDATRRADAFALSQPANNPKNWKAISTSCIDVLEKIKTKVDEARIKLVGTEQNEPPQDSDEEDNVNRNLLLMPPAARGQLFSARTRNRHKTALRPVKKIVTTSPPSLTKKLSMWTLHSEETGLISKLESEMVILVIETLDMMIIASFIEDQFGVIQKDLPVILKGFLALHNSIDRYLRFKAFSQASGSEILLKTVQEILVSSVCRIADKFTSSICSVGLNAQELKQYEGIVSQTVVSL